MNDYPSWGWRIRNNPPGFEPLDYFTGNDAHARRMDETDNTQVTIARWPQITRKKYMSTTLAKIESGEEEKDPVLREDFNLIIENERLSLFVKRDNDDSPIIAVIESDEDIDIDEFSLESGRGTVFYYYELAG